MRLLPLACLAFVAACSPAADQGAANQQGEKGARLVASVLDSPDARDTQSYARPLEARVTHVALDLRADFDAKRIGGTATLDVEAKPGAKAIVLDSKGLELAEVTDGNGRRLSYSLGKADPERGAPLTIDLQGARRIRIAYKSAPEAEALQWLTPEQTAGRKHPFLFSQGQAILNRTW
ncbi:MAG TPA: aminopeptidase, partial [Allosphingosinicella sp.]|nr:aminopeptidase [Allosphingosinicella sp.]